MPVPHSIVKGKEIVEDFKENKFHIVFTESIFPNQTLLIKQTLARIKIALFNISAVEFELVKHVIFLSIHNKYFLIIVSIFTSTKKLVKGYYN